MTTIVQLIDDVISDIENEDIIHQVRSAVKSLCKSFPIYSELHK